MTKIAVSGYASLDHVMTLDGVPTPGRTTTILSRPKEAWPRLGGSPSYVAAALAANGVDCAVPLTWVGSDEAGRDYSAGLARLGVKTEGIVALDSARTPIAILAYEPGGGCLCLYHPAAPSGLNLTGEHKRIIAQADWLCVTIGPTEATCEALALLPATTRLCWVVKDDPRAMPDELAGELAARADLICFSAAEAAFVHKAQEAAGTSRADVILIETRGGAGAQVRANGVTTFVPSQSLSIIDPTGAGDTFAGGALAALAKGETDPVKIVQSGHKAAYALLSGRVDSQKESA